jgi:Tfp pilus assembly protein PilN
MQLIWPQIWAAVVVSLCSALVTWMVQRAAKRLENVATKDFVSQAMVEHTTLLKLELVKMFVERDTQKAHNETVEHRLRLLESVLQGRLGDILKAS